jgi:hypothetical protein
MGKLGLLDMRKAWKLLGKYNYRFQGAVNVEIQTHSPMTWGAKANVHPPQHSKMARINPVV